jgi:hypothetical protein
MYCVEVGLDIGKYIYGRRRIGLLDDLWGSRLESSMLSKNGIGREGHLQDQSTISFVPTVRWFSDFALNTAWLVPYGGW